MVIKGILSWESLGWNLAWGKPPITKKIHLGILVYQRWRYKTWDMDLRILTLLKKARWVWRPKRFWRSITFFFVKNGSEILEYVGPPGSGPIPDLTLGATTEDSGGGEKCSKQGSGF